MTTMLRNAGLVLIAVVVRASERVGCRTVAQCQRAIVKASSQFAQARMKALQKCDEGVLKGRSRTVPRRDGGRGDHQGDGQDLPCDRQALRRCRPRLRGSTRPMS